jgi:hypothetical protein
LQPLDKTVVASDDDIKTRDIFAPDRYSWFAFALDSLPLFKKSDSAAARRRARRWCLRRPRQRVQRGLGPTLV